MTSDDFLKKDRKEWLRTALEDYGVESYGRATQMSEALGCGMSTVQGWLRGSLPRDLVLAQRVAETYQFDLVEWITLRPSKSSSRSQNNEQVLQAVKMTKEFEIKQGGESYASPLNPESFTKIFSILLLHLSGETPIM